MNNRKFKNLIGETFNYLTVIEGPIRYGDKKGLFWKCKCVCGNEKIAYGESLKRGQTKSCGCKNYKNLLGQTFTYLTVIEGPIRYDDKKNIYWKCKCKCGNEKIVTTNALVSGNTKSCGCYKNEIFIENNKKRMSVDITNQRFGKLIAKYPTDKRNKDHRIIWFCECDCGNTKEVAAHDLLQGKVQSCGCMRSSGEMTIENLLKQNNISYQKQKQFDTCRFPENNYFAKFDFFIENKYLIEYDGEQHFYYKDNPHTWNTKSNYLIVKSHDEFKNQWCKNNNIPLIRIPYTHLNDLCIEDLLLETSKFII